MNKWLKENIIKALDDLHQGETGKIISISGKAAEHRYLHLMGITVGRKLTVIKIEITPRERIVTVKAGDIELVMDKHLIHNIRLEVPMISVESRLSNVPNELAIKQAS
jgi:Fe2+ transport system protein FeoA